MTEVLEHRASMPTLTEWDDEPRTCAVRIIQAKARDRGALVQMSGLEAGRLYSLASLTTLGRGRDCSARFDDASLSRVHAILSRDGGRFTIEDRQSLNGSFVNDRRIDVAVLLDGDRIRLGSGVSLRFH